MNEVGKYDKSRVSRTTDKFDRVLKRHIRRLLDVSESDNAPPYSLNMIACLLVLAEREKELTEFAGSPLKHYTRDGFLKDLDEIGIDPDETIMVEIQNLAQNGYILINENEEYRIQESALKQLSALDAIFPAFPGLSLVAYILQAIEEVLSGRKEMMQAIRQFDETLLTRGESVSKQRLDALRRERAAAAVMKRIDPVTMKQREAVLEKLKTLRSKQKDPSADAAVVLTTGYTGKIEIRELFPRETEKLEPIAKPETPPTPPTEQVMPSQPVVPETKAPSPPYEPIESPSKTEPIAHSTDIPETIELEPPPMEDDTETDMESDDETAMEDLIAQRIQAFEEQLAMVCPVCKEGKILTDVTEKGKTYYYCSNKACGLVSWGKPHHMPCPLCENPFLVEFSQKEGGVGLKCPRATCTYQQADFDGKHFPSPPGAAKGDNVRKVLVRKKGGSQGGQRRLVRRKK